MLSISTRRGERGGVSGVERARSAANGREAKGREGGCPSTPDSHVLPLRYARLLKWCLEGGAAHVKIIFAEWYQISCRDFSDFLLGAPFLPSIIENPHGAGSRAVGAFSQLVDCAACRTDDIRFWAH